MDTYQELTQMSAARLNEIGNQAIQAAQQNSERLSAMFGMRAAQANPIEAASINSLEQKQDNSELIKLLTLLLAKMV